MSDKPTILVTGGAGYIGSHTCKALAAAGYLPVTFDNLCNGHDWAVKWGPLEEGDVLDAARLTDVLARYDFAGVMHFAAFIEVGESVRDPARFHRNNVEGTASLINALAGLGPLPFVFSSSAAVYGLPQSTAPIAETATLAPINPYGETKLAAERLLEQARDIRSVRLRYFNAAGADPGGALGEEHDPESHLIPLALQAARGGAPLTVFGTDYPTPDGTAIRDYVHVADLAAAHVAALSYLLNGGEPLALNLGSGRGHSVLEVLAAAEHASGGPVPLSHAPRRAGDPTTLVADPENARKVLKIGFEQSQDLDQIVKSAWEWLSVHRAKVAN